MQIKTIGEETPERAMRIGVIGGGVVGHATARTYLEFVEDVLVYDVISQRGNVSLDSVLAYSDITFICIPENKLDQLFSCFPPENRSARLVLKSTVPLGTTRLLGEKYGLVNLVHSPEFLTSRCALTDAQIPARNIIGRWSTKTDLCWLLFLYQQRFPGVPNYTMTSEESEAVKLIQNTYFAVQVAFWNEANSLVDHHEMNWGVILSSILADGRINRSHTQVPGPDGQFGFGGTCLPKDLRMFTEALRDVNLPNDVSRAALIRNLWDRKREV